MEACLCLRLHLDTFKDLYNVHKLPPTARIKMSKSGCLRYATKIILDYNIVESITIPLRRVPHYKNKACPIRDRARQNSFREYSELSVVTGHSCVY